VYTIFDFDNLIMWHNLPVSIATYHAHVELSCRQDRSTMISKHCSHLLSYMMDLNCSWSEAQLFVYKTDVPSMCLVYVPQPMKHTHTHTSPLALQVEAGFGSQDCLLFEGNEPGHSSAMSYSQVLDEVCRVVSGGAVLFQKRATTAQLCLILVLCRTAKCWLRW